MTKGLVGGEGFAVDASLIRADANRQTDGPGSEGLPPDADNRATREYLAVLDDAAFGAATPVVPKFLAPADPASRWTCAHGGQACYAYSTNYLIDLDHAVIMDVEASTAVRQAEVTACKRMIARTQDRFGVWPERLAADTGYGSAEMLAWLVHERDIHPHIPVFDKSVRHDGTFERADFSCDIERDLYRYRARKAACDACALRPRCCPNSLQRKILRSIHEGARDLARDIATTDACVTSRRERKKVEMLFAHLKRILKLDRLRLRGPNGAKDAFLLAATAQNLRKMARLILLTAQLPPV